MIALIDFCIWMQLQPTCQNFHCQPKLSEKVHNLPMRYFKYSLKIDSFKYSVKLLSISDISVLHSTLHTVRCWHIYCLSSYFQHSQYKAVLCVAKKLKLISSYLITGSNLKNPISHWDINRRDMNKSYGIVLTEVNRISL